MKRYLGYFFYLLIYIYIFFFNHMFLFWIIYPSFRRWEHEKFLATSISSPSPPNFVLYYFYSVQIYNIHILFWNHHCYDCLASVLCVNGFSDHQQFFWHGFTMLAFFILWIFRLPSFGYQAVLSNKCAWIFCFPEPLYLNCTWGHPLFSQNCTAVFHNEYNEIW